MTSILAWICLKTMKLRPMMYDVSGRGLASIARATAISVALCFATAAPAVNQPSPSVPAATPAATHGEFDNLSALDLASGQTVKTDCSVNWTAEDGKVYCFSTEASKEAFLKNPTENVQKAREFYIAKDLAKDNSVQRTPAAASASSGPTKDFTEDDVDAAVKKVVDERTKDGAFVFRDPKLNADLNLIFENIKGVRGMTGYGWFANVIFHDKDDRLLVQARGVRPEANGNPRTERAEAGRRRLDHDYSHARRLVVAPGAGASGRYGGDPRLAGDERHPQLHRHP
jgi:YHS domain-containing protein